MSGVSISLSGGDSATYHANNRIVSKMWRFPDGMERLISMPGWYWGSIERISSHELYRDEDLGILPYEISCDSALPEGLSFEEHLRKNFQLCARLIGELLNEDEYGSVNDNNIVSSPMYLKAPGALSVSFNDQAEEWRPEIFKYGMNFLDDPNVDGDWGYMDRAGERYEEVMRVISESRDECDFE